MQATCPSCKGDTWFRVSSGWIQCVWCKTYVLKDMILWAKVDTVTNGSIEVNKPRSYSRRHKN